MREFNTVSPKRMENGYISAVKNYFKLMDLHPGSYWSTLDYMIWINARQTEYRKMTQVQWNGTAAFFTGFDKWLAEQVSGDIYVYLRPRDETRIGIELNTLKSLRLPIDDRFYRVDWSGKLGGNPDPDSIRLMLTENESVRGMTTGDVIVIRKNGERSAWFLNSDYFERIDRFERLVSGRDCFEGKPAKCHVKSLQPKI